MPLLSNFTEKIVQHSIINIPLNIPLPRFTGGGIPLLPVKRSGLFLNLIFWLIR